MDPLSTLKLESHYWECQCPLSQNSSTWLKPEADTLFTKGAKRLLPRILSAKLRENSKDQLKDLLTAQCLFNFATVDTLRTGRPMCRAAKRSTVSKIGTVGFTDMRCLDILHEVYRHI